MTKLWCKLWNMILNIFTSVIEGVGFLLETLGTVLVDIISGVADSVGGALGLPGGAVMLLGLGLGLYLIISSKDGKRESYERSPPSGVNYDI